MCDDVANKHRIWRQSTIAQGARTSDLRRLHADALGNTLAIAYTHAQDFAGSRPDQWAEVMRGVTQDFTIRTSRSGSDAEDPMGGTETAKAPT